MSIRPCLAALLLFGNALPAVADSSAKLEYAPEARLGYGWNSIRNMPTQGRAVCIEHAEPKPFPVDDPSTRSSFRMVRSTTDVMDSFEMSVSAAFRGIVYNAGGEVGYATSKTISTDALSVAGSIEIRTRTNSLYAEGLEPGPGSNAGLRLSDEYRALLLSEKAADRKKFFTDCGDSFVSDIYRGGHLNVFLSIVSQDATTRESVRAKFEAAGAGGSLTAEAVAQAVSETKGTRISGDFYAVGGVMKEAGISSPEALMDLMDAFGTAVDAKDAGIAMRVTSYWALLPDAESRPWGVPKNFDNAARTYQDLGSLWSETRAIKPGDPAYDWTRATGTACLGKKADEMLDVRTGLKTSLEACGHALDEASGAENCSSIGLRIAEPEAGECPATPMLTGGPYHDVYDFRVFLPPPRTTEAPDHCWIDRDHTASRVWSAHVAPIVSRRCADRPEDRPECRSDFRDRVQAAVPLGPVMEPKPPRSGYQRSCSKCTATLKPRAQVLLRCSCNGKKPEIVLACPPRGPIQNCHGELKKGKSC